MDKLAHCIYTSAATRPMGLDDLLSLLAEARRNNAVTGVTGMLLYCDGSFFQVLEGTAENVDACFERIREDPRHTKVTRIIRESISRCDFEEWSMGFAEMTQETLLEIEGLNDFFSAGTSFQRLDAGRAKKLLSAFARGRWRSTISGVPPREAHR